MHSSQILAIAVALAMDAFAVSLAIGATRKTVARSEVARVSVTFGAFQGGMPVLGWIGGAAVHQIVSRFGHWVAFGILVAIGIRMISSAFGRGPSFRSDPTTGILLLGLAAATSIDALATGFSLAMVQIPVWFPALVIATVTAVLSTVALLVGKGVGVRARPWAEIAGGAILCAIGIKILIEHSVGPA